MTAISRDAAFAVMGAIIPLLGLCVLAGSVPSLAVVEDAGFWWMVFCLWFGSFSALQIRRLMDARTLSKDQGE